MQLKPLDLPSADGIWHNLRLSNDLETILENACLVIENGITQWWGHYEELPSSYQNLRKQDGQGMLVTPGLVDCHGHWVYAGTRAKEFAMRLEGARYEEIAQAGGGIVSTVRATREASVAELFALARPKVAQLLEEGVVALECKSGYGLSLEHERKQLQTARLLAQYFQVDIQNTFLGAHALPPEFQGRSDDYIDLVCHEMLPKLVEEGLVDAVDVFCENIAFTLVQTQKVFETAKSLGIPVKVHAEQLSNMGATALAAQYKALSADHIEFLDEKGVKAMAESGMTAVLLPGAFYFLRETQHPPIELLRTYKVPMAISTDHNPGTSPTCSLLLMLNMACTLFRLTVPEGLAAVTRHAAGALGWEKRFGSLHLQHKAQFVLWNIQDPKELANTIGINPAVVSVRQGKIAKDIRKQFTL